MLPRRQFLQYTYSDWNLRDLSHHDHKIAHRLLRQVTHTPVVRRAFTNKTDKREKKLVWLDHRQVTALTKIKGDTLAPIATLVRQAIDEFLDRRKKK